MVKSGSNPLDQPDSGVSTGEMTAGNGQVVLSEAELTLSRGDRTVRLTRRAVDVLQALRSRSGALVGREELMKTVWGDVVVDDAALKQYVYLLRAAFRDLDPDREYIETVPRQGYRLVLPVEARSGNGLGAAAAWETPAGPPATRIRTVKFWTRAAVAILVAGLAAAGAWVSWRKARAAGLVEEGFRQLRTNRTIDLASVSEPFSTALEYDPESAPAYAGLAQTMARNSKRFQGHALEMARKSLELDASCGLCQSTYGWILLTREWNWTEAGAALERGVRLDPKFLEGRIWRAQWLACTRRLDEAKREVDAAAELAPGLAAPYAMRAGVYYLAGEYQRAVDEGGRTLAVQSRSNAAYDWMWRASCQLRANENALLYWTGYKGAFLNISLEVEMQDRERLLKTYRERGLPGIVASLLQDMGDPTAIDAQRYQRAVWRMWNSDRTGALEELEAAVESRPFHLIYVAADPAFEPLHTEPRFQRILDRLGITPNLAH